MRHLKKTKKLNRTEEQRSRLARDLMTALIQHDSVLTFTTRAKWVRPKIERLISLVKRANGNTQKAFSAVRPYLSEPVARKLIETIVPKLSMQNGGYTQIIKIHKDFSTHDQCIIRIVATSPVAPPAKKLEKDEESKGLTENKEAETQKKKTRRKNKQPV